ncbi:DEAD/DEAH box helicase family protein [Methanolobus sp.]|uniref:DEAD/DEAH box helicase family protein n=1 Tax=Methanolobus sp. TaxID=1874737 RepID=UPI0025D3AE5F|nr:DEAD/DEAH box helicase family protein [Methanolobus sp.]
MNEKKVSFKKISSSTYKPTNPEVLWRDLTKKNRNPTIESLWSHQADILRDYMDNIEAKDVALELPTGSGKTLVGLLIGEYRRVVNNERILYLCPTKQLVFQVLEKATGYNIKAHAFVGTQREYNVENFNDFLSADAIAVSTYSALFNYGKYFSDANVIICDDAHGAESYISSMWSLNISSFHDLYNEIINLFQDVLPKAFVDSLYTSSTTRKKTIEKVHNHHFYERVDRLEELLSTNLSRDQPNLYYPYLSIQDNLAACNMYVSPSEILIRPWIPPTLSHDSFISATQRIYMSATLGKGGELERIIGMPEIRKLSVPAGWDKQGSGRRFFVLPDNKYKMNEYIHFIADNINKRDRTLILCPDNQTADLIKYSLGECGVSHTYYTAEDIEESLDAFVADDHAILLLTNRYDGIDLADEACRQLIIAGLPAAANLQERFLLSRLGIISILKDRIRTRFTQASGRCTRGASDYSVVIPITQDLFKYCQTKENRDEMHPELHAELKFGLQQSKEYELDDLSELIDLFMEHGEDWESAEESIKEFRDDLEIVEDNRSIVLNSIVKDEVLFQNNLWNKHYDDAFIQARKIIDRLSGDDFSDYRALWSYFAGNAALLQYHKANDTTYLDSCDTFYTMAKKSARTISWFANLRSPKRLTDDIDLDALSGYAIEHIIAKINKLGLVGPKFNTKMKNIKDLISADSANEFEMGLTNLGELLGFETDHPGQTADPDSIWMLNNNVLVLFEAKSDEKEEGDIFVRTCRQARGHYEWAKHNISNYDEFEIKICVVISKKPTLSNDAIAQSNDLYYVNIDEIRHIFETVSGILSRIRSQSNKVNDDKIRIKLYEELKAADLDPECLIAKLNKTPLKSLSET